MPCLMADSCLAFFSSRRLFLPSSNVSLPLYSWSWVPKRATYSPMPVIAVVFRFSGVVSQGARYRNGGRAAKSCISGGPSYQSSQLFGHILSMADVLPERT